MDNSAKYKEKMIREYITSVNFKSPDLSVNKIKNDLREVLKETPGIDLEWKRDLITEGKKVIVKNEKVKSITIAFSDGFEPDGKPKLHKFKYIIE